MLNQIVLVGRLVNEPTIEENESGKKVGVISLAIPRSYKNMNGEYDTDFVDVTLWNGIAENTTQYCKKGDIVGVKGRIQSHEDKSISLVAEKVTFLSSKRSED